MRAQKKIQKPLCTHIPKPEEIYTDDKTREQADHGGQATNESFLDWRVQQSGQHTPISYSCVTFGKNYLLQCSQHAPSSARQGSALAQWLGIKLKNISRCMYKNAHASIIYLFTFDTYTRLYLFL